jgi:aspartate racemase
MSEQLLLNDIDQNKLLYQFNDTKVDYPKEKVFHDLFEEQAVKTPDNIAVVYKDEKLSYRELNERSNQLARILRVNGVGPEQVVGLMVDDNSIEMVIGIISILKAGGAFLPIDQDFPKERIEYIFKDSSISVLLSTGELKNEIQFEGKVVNPEDKSLFDGDGSNLEKINCPNDLAYVIYTSGSTGNPKGVQIEHTSIVNQIFGLEKLYPFNSSLNHILLAPFTFDPSVQQVFLPLTSGGKLFLVPKSVKHNVKELWEFIVSNKIDIVNTVPSLMSLLLDHAAECDELHFKYIILAGESFSKNLYTRLRDTISADKIINIYGPTEATINTTLYECKLDEVNDTIPIGKPLMNYAVFILDELWELTPIGIPGEICISGVGLARGYLNNKVLTEEKFVDNPYLPSDKMYRTGDLGKWTEDGNIEFLGRIDYQIKINGMRVELGEIETSLSQHPSIQESIVINQKYDSGKTRLIAYIVPKQRLKIHTDELRSFLKDKLPDYMIPSAFVFMGSFPLTTHGKVDRRALPEPEQINHYKKEGFVPPRSELEIQLTKIWEKVLGIKPIGIKDEFFDLGGTSLLAMDLFAQIEKKFGQRLPLALIIDAPMVEKLARIIEEGKGFSHWSPLVAIQPEGSNLPFFCIHGHKGNVLGFHDLARYMGKDQPFYGLQAAGLDGKPFNKYNIHDMAYNYLKEIRKIQTKGPYFIGGWCMGGLIAFEMAQILQANNEKVSLLAMIEAPFEEIYPKRLPEITFSRRMINKIFDRIRFENLVLKSLSSKRKLSYISGKMKIRLTNYQVRLEKIIGSFLSRFNLSIKHSFIYKLTYLYDAHVEAIVSYKPQPYSGKVSVFKADRQPLGIYSDPKLGWGDFFKGEVDIFEFPGHHLNTFIDPSLRVLAKQLNDCINKAKQKL